jgi:hypothetical protein
MLKRIALLKTIGKREHFDISSTAFITSVELVSNTWPPKIISSSIVCICRQTHF